MLLTRAFTGLDTNMLRPSIAAAGLDPAALPTRTPNEARKVFGSEGSAHVRRWVDVWSAGHTVSRVDAVRSVAELVEPIDAEYAAAQRETAALLASAPPRPQLWGT